MEEERPRERIDTAPNEEGRVIINLYGQDIEIDSSMFDKEGHAELKKFAKIYDIYIPVNKKRSSKKEEVKPEVIEEPEAAEEIEESESIEEELKEIEEEAEEPAEE